MTNIEFGDKVRHKINNDYNALLMTVTDIEDYCIEYEYFDSKEKVSKKGRFDRDDLEIVKKPDGGFIP